MGLRTTLYALNEQVVSPCYRDDYESDFTKQAISATAYQIPLPWLAMFRVPDVREEEVPTGEEDESEVRVAPVTTMSKAKENLLGARETARKAFPQCPTLGDYFEVMAKELSLFPFPFVTIDATELYPEITASGRLLDPWAAVLSGFDSPDSAAQYLKPSIGDRVGAIFGRPRKDPWLQAINYFVTFVPERSIPDPNYQRHGTEITSEELDCFCSLLPGGEYHTSVWQEDDPGQAD